MHVLLLSSNDLNEKNIFASTFELTQAKAIKDAGVKVGILSVGHYSTLNVAKAIFKKVLFSRSDYYRLKDLSLVKLSKDLVSTIINCFLNRTNVRRLELDGVTVYEAVFNVFHSKMNKRWHQKWTNHGYRGFEAYVQDQGRPDVLHAHSRFLLAGLLATLIKEKTKMPYVVTTHSSFYKRNLIKDFQIPMIKTVLQQADEILAVSQTLAEDINAKLQTNFEMLVLANMLDKNYEEIVLPSERNTGFTFLNIGRLDQNKNQQLLIRSFALLARNEINASLRIGGDGPEMPKLKKLAAEEQVEGKVTFLGHLGRTRVIEEILHADVFCLSSYYETFGVAVIEALACGKPVIVSDCGGPSELVNHANGLIVKGYDFNVFASAMYEMILNHRNYDPVQIRQNCLGQYSSKQVAERLITVYKSILERASESEFEKPVFVE